MNSTLKTLFLWMAIFVVVILLWNTFQHGKAARQELTFSEFSEALERGRIEEVTIRGQQLTGKFKGGGEYTEGQEFLTKLPEYPDLVKDLRAANVEIHADEPRDNPLLTVLFTWAPMLLIIALWIFFMRQMQTGGNKALSFGKSKAKLLNTSGKQVTFKDVAGVEEAKEELSEIVEFLKEPQKFQKLGGRIPKGVLLMGPPGTGKTLLARAIAGEANVPFFSISGSDFVEMFVGVGASRVRDLFEQGKKNAPCIIFIDEIDAVGRHRGAGLGGGHDEREQTLNQLLVEMDGFESNEGVILIAATNRPDVLDPALLRPGRFDRRVVVDRPDINGRVGILKVHTQNIPLDDRVDLPVIARGTPGFAGADLANLVNEAALIAARRNKKKVEMEDFEFAKDKVLMGVERKTLMLTDEEKRVTAYHEAGHALVAAFTPGADPLHKVTIIPRGRALGLTMQLPTEDKYTYRKQYVRGADRHPDGRPGGRGADAGRHHHRRRQRHRARHRHGAAHGLRVGHVRARAALVRRQGRAGLPRPRLRAARRLQPGHGDPDRPRGRAHRAGTATRARARSSPSTGRCSTDVADDSARARVAGRRGGLRRSSAR